jgi:hypothetical protein
MLIRRLATPIALALVLAACGGGVASVTPGDSAEPATTTTTGPTVTAPAPDTGPGELPAGVSALVNPADPSLPAPLVDPAEIISGGPPPDGIPPIDDPKFRSIEEADASLADTEPVVVLDIDGDARAYPVEILIWHEIVNDTVGGVPVAVTYCPLCNSAVTYRREVRGTETTFGTSGMLFSSALVMYDRATESLWTHFDGRAVAGVLAGDRLQPIPSPLLAWSDFKAAYPDGQVLSRDTGFRRDYGRNPYFGYDNPDTNPFLFRGTLDERARAKQRVVGVAIADAATAFSLDALATGQASALNTEVGGTAVVILWRAGQNTALEEADTSKGRDVGSVGVFLPVVDGRTLTFQADGDRFVDTDTGTRWDITGQAITGELTGTRLERIPHLDTFWFAWSTYQPDTDLIETLG